MVDFLNVLTWFLWLSITTKSDHSIPITTDTLTGHPIYYTSYHFDYNNALEWSTNLPTKNTYPYTLSNQQIISCTIDIPSLCIYTHAPNPGFLVFYKDLMFDFLNDSNWTKIIIFPSVTRTPHNPTQHTIRPLHRRLADTNEKLPGMGSLLSLAGSGGLDKLGGLSGLANGATALGHASDLMGRRNRGYGRRRRRRRGGLFGRRRGGLFGRRCSRRILRRMRCGRSRCGRPCFITYLGAPHVIGAPQWIFGGPLRKRRPLGFRMAGAFPMGLGSSPMYPGLMGGYPGVSSPYMWPGTYHGATGFSGMPGGLTMMGTVPDYTSTGDALKNMMGTLSGGMGGLLGRRGRRLADEDVDIGDGFYGSDVRLKKCAFVSDKEEICAVYLYEDGSVQLEYNVVREDDVMEYEPEMDLEDYMKGSMWIWKVGKEMRQCNDDLLDVEGYSVCVEVRRKGLDVYVIVKKGLLVHTMKFISEKGCDKVYVIVNMSGGKKICGVMDNIEICLQIMDGVRIDEMIITAHRIWMDEDE